MASALDNFEKGLAHNDLDSASEGKGTNQHIDHVGKDEKGGVLEAGISPQERRIFQAPELVRNMSHEEREYAEKRLRRKIDARLMPMIVLMYILNYLDRVYSSGLFRCGFSLTCFRTILQLPNLQVSSRISISRALSSRYDILHYAGVLLLIREQTSVSILFVGYLLMQVPSNLFLNKIGKPAIYLPACMVVWGIISAATAACQNYAGLIACRFMLGFVEAAYFVSFSS